MRGNEGADYWVCKKKPRDLTSEGEAQGARVAKCCKRPDPSKKSRNEGEEKCLTLTFEESERWGRNRPDEGEASGKKPLIDLSRFWREKIGELSNYILLGVKSTGGQGGHHTLGSGACSG